MSKPNLSSTLRDVRLTRRTLAGGALLAAGLGRSRPLQAAAASHAIDIPGAVCGIASPFSDEGFSGNSSGFYYSAAAGVNFGSLSEAQRKAISTGFKAGFSFPQVDKVVEGPSGKGSDAYFNLFGFLFDNDAHALKAAQAFLAVNMPDGTTSDTETLSDGSTLISYFWEGTPDGYTVEADGWVGVVVAGAVVIAFDWEDFTEPQSDDEVANLKAQIAAAIAASRKGYPMAEGVLRVDGVNQVVFNVIKGFGSTFGEGTDYAIGVYLDYASSAGTYVRSTGEYNPPNSSDRYSIATEELTFDSDDDAASFFSNRRDLISDLDSNLSRTRQKSNPNSKVPGADGTEGDFIVTSNPSGSLIGYETTVRFGNRVVSVTFTNSLSILPAVSDISNVSTSVRSAVSNLSFKAAEALDLGKSGDAVYEAGFGRAVSYSAL